MSTGYPTKKLRSGRQKPSDHVDRFLREYRLIDGHQCTLPIAEDVLSMYLNEGPFVLCRRRLKQMCLISEKLPRTKMVFRSSLRIGMEKQRHLRHYYWTIHPFSEFRFHWEIFMGLIFLTTIIFMPIYNLNVMNPFARQWSIIYYHCLNVACFADIIMTCFTGYLDKNSETVVLNKKQILRHYALRYMFFDIAATFPFTYFLSLFYVVNIHWAWTANRYFRVVRLFTAINYLENLMDLMRVKHYYRQFIRRFLIFGVFVEYATYFSVLGSIWIINKLDLWGHVHLFFGKFVYCTHRTLFLINPHHFGKSDVQSMSTVITQFFLLHCGNVFNALLLAIMLRIYNRTALVSRKHEYLARQIKEYAKFKELPDSMDRVLLQFIDFKFGRRIYDEDLIIGTLTPQLKDELVFLYSQKLVENVQLFKDMPTSVIKRIAVRLKPEIILPNDVIIQAGYEGSSMYFIIAGVVAVYTITGKEVCHLTDGANFGEIALLMNESRTASIVAADFCELFKLNRKDFQEAIEPFPELKERMFQLAKERYTTISSFPDNDTKNTAV